MGKTKETPAETGPKETSPKADSEGRVLSGKVVRYIGTADVREIDKAGWDNAGVTDQNKVVWNRKNNWTVPVEDLSDAAVAYADEQDSGFVVTDLDVDK